MLETEVIYIETEAMEITSEMCNSYTNVEGIIVEPRRNESRTLVVVKLKNEFAKFFDWSRKQTCGGQELKARLENLWVCPRDMNENYCCETTEKTRMNKWNLDAIRRKLNPLASNDSTRLAMQTAVGRVTAIGSVLLCACSLISIF